MSLAGSDSWDRCRAFSFISLFLNLHLILVVGLAAEPACGQIEFKPSVTYPTSIQPRSLACGDFNYDRSPDIVIAGKQVGEVSVHFGNWNGGFSIAVVFDVGESTAGGCLAADLNSDGWDDIVTSNIDKQNVSVLLNTRYATFEPAVLYATGDRCWNVEGGDLDGDTSIDLVTSNSNSDDVSVLLNNQNGTFAPAVSYSAEYSPMDCAIADFNGDTFPDIAVANYSIFWVSVLLNNGNGTFQPRQRWSVGGGARGIVAVDLDRDGDHDLVTANSLTDDITILFNDGSGSFVERLDLPAGKACFQLAAADLDLDDDPDLLVVNNSPPRVALLKNHGDGSLAAPVFFETATAISPNDIVIADFNFDDLLDFAVTNPSADSFTVRLNATDKPPILFQTALNRGALTTFSISGARSDELIYFLFSLQGVAPGGLAPAALGGMCLDLVGPVMLIGAKRANAAGYADLKVPIPSTAPTVTVWTQAAIQRGTGGADSVKSQYIEGQIR